MTLCMDARICYNGGMKPREFWKAYAGDVAPADFLCRYQSRDPRRCAERYVSRLPAFLGIARRGSWKATFTAPRQYSRDEVIAGLTAYLEETRPMWEPVVAARDEQGRIECEQAEWERAEQERLEQEQAEWERAHAPEPAAAPAPAPSPETKPETQAGSESEGSVETSAGVAETPSLREDSPAGVAETPSLQEDSPADADRESAVPGG